MRTDQAIALLGFDCLPYRQGHLIGLLWQRGVHHRYLAVFDVCVRVFTHDGDDFRSVGAGGAEKGF